MTQNRKKKRKPYAKTGTVIGVKKSPPSKWENSNFLVTLATHARKFSRNHAILFSVFGAFVLAVPPYFVQQYYQVDKFAFEVKRYLPEFGNFLDQHVVIGVLLSSIWAFLLILFYKFLKSIYQENPNGWLDMPAILLKSLDNIVGSKEQRFSRYLMELRAAESSSNISHTFNAITQPAIQLKEIVQGIYAAMHALIQLESPGEKFTLKVNLAEMNNGLIEKIPFHYPSNHSIRTPERILNKPNSTIRISASSKSITIIESIKEELTKDSPRFHPDPARIGEDGSLICYPIFYEKLNSVIFVVSIYSDQPFYFKNRFKSSYLELLRPFELRMKLEFSLLAIRELSNEKAIESAVN
jgi:hypothetical protein